MELQIPIKGGAKFIVETNDMPDVVHEQALLKGYQALLNVGMDKAIGVSLKSLTTDADKAAARDKALEKAAATYNNLKAGKLRIVSAKADSSISRELSTEATRIAKGMVKDALKAKGYKVSYYPAKEITEHAKALLALDPSILEMARANLAARDEAGKAIAAKLADIATSAKQDPKLVKKAADEKAKRAAEKQLSATQAGKPEKKAGKTKRTKADAQTQATA